MLSIGLVVALLAGADALSSLQQLSVRTVHARLPVATMLLGSGGDVPSVPFADNYKPAEIAALWKALKQCYGDEEAARRAVEQNNQVLCPVYATPQLLTQTNAALVKLVGKEEALEILAMNPAVLTCGARELAAQKPADIRSAAQTRQVLDRVVTGQGFALFLLACGFLRVAFLVATTPR